MRYKEFNRNRVLEQCILLFWQNGFNSCPVSEIVDKTGVNRFSLYKEFTDKEGILYAALDLYQERYNQDNLKLLAASGSTKDVLLSFFSTYLEENNEHPAGCFTIHIATELADSNEKVKEELEKYTNTLESTFTSFLEQNHTGDMPDIFLAKHLVGLFCTSMCFCVIQSPEERLSHVQNGINIIFTKNKSYATNA